MNFEPYFIFQKEADKDGVDVSDTEVNIDGQLEILAFALSLEGSTEPLYMMHDVVGPD